MLILREDPREEAVICTFEGRLDNQTANQAQTSLESIQTRSPELPLILEMGNLEFLSSAGLRVLLIAMKSAKANQSRILIASPSDAAREILDISGFSSMMPIFPTTEKALAECQK